VPGQVFYNTTRKLVLKGVDGLVFVADSQRPMREANIESLESLIDNLNELGLEVDDLPLVMQYNKRDLKNVLTVEELNSDLNAERKYAFFESEAINGVGVFETLKEITKLTLKKLRKRMVAPHAAAPGPRAAAAQPQSGPATASPKRPASVSAAALARAAEEGVTSAPADGGPVPEAEIPPASEIEQPPAVAAAAPETELAPSAEGYGAEVAEPLEAVDEQLPEAEPLPDFDEPFGSEDEAIDDAEEEESELTVAFDQTDEETVETAPPPMKRVQLSNQMDILAELEGLRKHATMDSAERWGRSPDEDVDIESLLAGSDPSRELNRTVLEPLNSDIFRNMRGLLLAVRVQNSEGETIHTLEPVSLSIEKATKLEKLSVRFTLDLENQQ
jgi:hypothetical protein